jgi:hypothetical protein
MDHIRDWFVYKDRTLTESEYNLVVDFRRLSWFGDRSVYFNKEGKLLPARLRSMFSIRSYAMLGGDARAGKQWFDL